MSSVVIFSLPTVPENTNKVISLLKEALPDTRAFDGNRSALLCLEEDGRVTVVETWDSLAHYQRYDRWRAETGFTDLFESLVAGEPSERHLEVIDS